MSAPRGRAALRAGLVGRVLVGRVLVGRVLVGTALLGSVVAGPGTTVAGAQTGTAEIEIQSVAVAGEQTVRAVVTVPPGFDQVQLRPDSFAVTIRGALVPTRITRDVQPIDVVMAIDVSGSMKGPALAAAKNAALGFVSRIPADGRVAVVSFGDGAAVVSPLSADRAVATQAITGLAAAGETSLFDGLRSAAVVLDRSSARRVVVLMTDGRDTASAATAADAAAAVSSAGADLYGIALRTSDSDRNALDSLVSRAGGRVIEATDAASLSSAYGEVAARITNRYVVDITSTARGAVELAVSVAQDGRIATAVTTAQLTTETVTAPARSVSTTAAAPTSVSKRTWVDRFGLPAGIVAVAAALVALVLVMADPSVPARRLARGRSLRSRGSGVSVDAAKQRLVGWAEHSLDRSDRRALFDRALENASIDMRPAEFVVAVVGIAGLAALVAWIAAGAVAAIAVALMAAITTRLALRMRATRRRRHFLDGLDSALTTLAGSLRAGHGLPQALDTVARESEGPIGEEFGRVVIENRLGRDVVDSLHAVERRVGGGDFSWVVKAISIQRELGGDLAEILDNVAATIRDRNRVRAQVRALSAEGRFSAIVLFSLPIVTVAAVAALSPEYLSSMTEGLLGWFVIGLTCLMMVIGGLWMRKIVNIRF